MGLFPNIADDSLDGGLEVLGKRQIPARKLEECDYRQGQSIMG